MFKRVKQFRVGAMHFSQTASEQSGVSPLPRSAIGRVHIVRPILRRSTHLYLNYSLFTILSALRRVAAAALRSRARSHYPANLAAQHTFIPQLLTLHYPLCTAACRRCRAPQSGAFTLSGQSCGQRVSTPDKNAAQGEPCAAL